MAVVGGGRGGFLRGACFFPFLVCGFHPDPFCIPALGSSFSGESIFSLALSLLVLIDFVAFATSKVTGLFLF